MSGLTIALIVAGIALIGGVILIHYIKSETWKIGIYITGIMVVFICGMAAQSFDPYYSLPSNGSFKTASQIVKDDVFYLNLKNLKSGKIEPYKIKCKKVKNKDMSPIEQFPPFFNVLKVEHFGHWEKDQFKKIESVYFIIPIEKK